MKKLLVKVLVIVLVVIFVVLFLVSVYCVWLFLSFIVLLGEEVYVMFDVVILNIIFYFDYFVMNVSNLVVKLLEGEVVDVENMVCGKY